MTGLPAPLVAPEVDLQDFPFMPLHVARLRDSSLAAEEHPEACWYAVLLWAASWHQIPAASLPNSDVALMRLVGLGRDERTWRKYRSGALHGFVLCEDGRLYHPIVAENAIEAWNRKLAQKHRTFCNAVRKHNERNPDKTVKSPSFEEWEALGRPDRVVPVSHALSRVTGENVARDNASNRQGQGQGQGHILDIEPIGSIVEVADLDEDQQGASDQPANGHANGHTLFGEPPPPAKPELKPEHVVEAWNRTAIKISRPTVRDLTPERRQAVKARIAGYAIEDFLAALGKVERSPFLRGDKGWKGITFDWFIKKANFQKVIEGNYDE